MLLFSPLSQAGATCFTPVIVQGGCLYVEKGFDPGRVLAAIEQHGNHCILMVPTMISAVLDHPRLTAFDLSPLETIFYGASPMTPTRPRQGIASFGPHFFQFSVPADALTTVTVMSRTNVG